MYPHSVNYGKYVRIDFKVISFLIRVEIYFQKRDRLLFLHIIITKTDLHQKNKKKKLLHYARYL